MNTYRFEKNIGNHEKSIKIFREKISILYQNLASGVAISLSAGIALVFGFDGHSIENHNYRLIWLILLTFVLSVRLYTLYNWIKNQKLENINLSYELLKFRIGVIVTASLWSAYCLYFHQCFDVYEAASTMVIISAMTGGAATVLAGDKIVSLAYTTILLIPYSLYLIFNEQYKYEVLGILGILYSIIMFISSAKSASFILSSIELKYKNEDLLQNLEREVIKRTKEVFHLSQYDSLTHIINRKTFLEKTQEKITTNSKKKHAIFFIDLNGFKDINDNFGHSAGDTVLIRLAHNLKQWASDEKIVCRWGGDEFVIFSEINNRHDAEALSVEINSLIKKDLYVKSNAFELSAAIGVAIYPDHASDINHLITCADLAMYHNKNNKEDSYFIFRPEIATEALTRYQLCSKLKNAITKNQLSVLFQPIINTRNNKFESVEILLRWHLDEKMIPPDVFIPLAEKNGSIIKIGYWVLEQAISHMKKMDELGFTIKICVNVSSIQFKEKDFVDHILSILEKFNFPPQRLQLELTESIFSVNNSLVIDSIKILQKNGIRISIDDFGTGYSSLSLIQKMNIDIVKIDKSFVSEINTSGIDVIKAVMIMSNGLGFEVVAEGVESASQAITLKSMGIHYLQGYFFSKPITFDEFVKVIRNNPQDKTPL
ncbi:putative bifunctional diguanylate cyclase/phosphodiesterase [Pectobacterium parmentieri]|uniref:putative bifunctional diguanylate cyclase/phosphodiesterase n=1 Tax=Pectobacterium parmentieri TaxID=1905730 RepID=UPI0020312F47|nr:bifunctional diguanylate cyclase/phosphodiesterase [Pectobacterium parmentieri]MCL6381500.1 bifunctional diguanylate cyclase/phosphodiesterase [Pectobacterium parmentieri]